MPDPLGQPGRANLGAFSGGSPNLAGGGETDWTLAALHTAAASLAGPGTSLLVGIAPSGAPWRGCRSSTSPRFSALASLAVSDCRPNVVSISFSVEQCSNGPSWTTRGRARFD